MANDSVAKLENILVDKLSQRYQMTKSDMKRVFLQADSDKSGFLNLQELSSVFEKFLVGVEPTKVQQLIACYDINGDGYISFEEFFNFIKNRNAVQTHQQVKRGKLSVGGNKNDQKEISELDSNELYELQCRVQSLLQNLRVYYLRNAQKRRKNERSSIQNHLTVHAKQLTNEIGQNLLLESFSRSTPPSTIIPFDTFCSTLRSFQLPGVSDSQFDVYQYLLSQCHDQRDVNSVNLLQFGNLVFSPNQQQGRSSSASSSKPSSLSASQLPLSSSRDKERIHHNPIQQLEPQSDLVVPRKFICSKSRTTYMTPTYFTNQMLAISNSIPSYNIFKKFVFGLRCKELYSGPPLHCLPPTRDNRNHLVVYSAASLGVIHDLTSNTQTYFEGHTDEINCINIDPSCTYVISGQLGRDPSLLLWIARTGELVKRIGAGFFYRGICAACFSFDSKYICAIGCDDHHSLGIWNIKNDNLICQTTVTNGVPPQIHALIWYPDRLANSFVTAGERQVKFWSLQKSEQIPQTDSLVYKIGNIKNQKSRNPSTDPSRKTSNPPQSYYCVAFLPPASHSTSTRPPTSRRNSSSEFNVVTGASDGKIYLWENFLCSLSVQASAHPIFAIKASQNILFCGCKEGFVKSYDSSLRPISEYFLLGDGVQQAIPVVVKSQTIRQTTSTTRSKSTTRPVSGSGSVSGSGLKSRSGSGSGSPRASSVSRRPSSRDDTHVKPSPSRKNPNQPEQEIIGIELDSIPFFFTTESGGLTSESLLVTLSGGSLLRVYINAPMNNPIPVFSFHVGPLWALSIGVDIFVTGGDDRWLTIWSSVTYSMLMRKRLPNAIRCCDLDHSNGFIAVGCVRGFISVHYYGCDISDTASEKTTLTDALATRHDCSEDISDIKFNPSADKIAVGSHDNFIDIYLFVVTKSRGRLVVSLDRHKRLRGHSSYLTHLDWSLDGRLLQSTCGAYELLYWDTERGTQFTSLTGWNPADLDWNTYTCVLGFSVMGIWPKYSDGTDINALDVSPNKSLVATADDSGHLNIFNYPCVARHPPHLTGAGHSSHVTNVRFVSDGQGIITVGGNDNCVILWSLCNPHH